MDVAEVELTVVLLVELEIALFLFVNELFVPGTHRDDAPAASVGRIRFCFCHQLYSHCLVILVRRIEVQKARIVCPDLRYSSNRWKVCITQYVVEEEDDTSFSRLKLIVHLLIAELTGTG